MSKYEMHPRGQHTSGLPSLCMVLTPDGGVIECKHQDSALRVIDLLNTQAARIAELEAENKNLRERYERLQFIQTYG